jgi:hypothetical protein
MGWHGDLDQPLRQLPLHPYVAASLANHGEAKALEGRNYAVVVFGGDFAQSEPPGVSLEPKAL